MATGWALFILVTIPLARSIQRVVQGTWHRDVFGYFIVVVLGTVLGAVVYLNRSRTTTTCGYIWLAAISAIFSAYTIRLMESSLQAGW